MTAIHIILAVAGTLFVTYGLLHEDKFVAFEDNLVQAIKNKFKK